MVGTDFPKGVHHVCVAVQTKDHFLGSSDGEFAPALNVLVVCQVKGTKAGLGVVSQEDIHSFAKVGLPHLVAGLKVSGGEKLVRLRVSNCNHVRRADLRSNRDVAREVKMDRQQDELVKWHQVVRCDERNVEHQHKSFLVRFVNVGCLHQEKVGRLVDERQHAAVASDFIDTLDRFDE
jgi:hypothetical protein